MSEGMDWAARNLDYEPPEVDTTVAHPARVYDYLLGGKDNYPPDRDAAEELLKLIPSSRITVTENRRFLGRLIRYLAVDRGMDQFFDVGTGIPTSPNVHEVAQSVNPAAHVVYVDNDPIVLAHAQALLTSKPEGRVAYVHADMRDADAVFDSREVRDTLDLKRPIALTILATVHLISDEEAHALVRDYVAQLPSGSLLALSATTADFHREHGEEAVSLLNSHGIPVRTRTKAEMELFFEGLEPIEPGVVQVHRWHPDGGPGGLRDADVAMYCGVAVKP